MVAAGVGCPRIRVRLGMIRAADGIQFSQDGYGGPWFTAFQEPFYSRHGHPFAVGNPQFVELGCQFGRGLEFLETIFRFRSHILRISTQVSLRIVNGGKHLLFQCLFIRNNHSPK